MRGRLGGKVALITGAASGIGLATAELFVREGAAVVLFDNQAEALEALAGQLRSAGHRASSVVGDVTRSEDLRRSVERAVSDFGRLDVLFANAGIGYSGELVDTTDDDWDRVMDVNAKGVFLSARESVRQMLAQEPPGGSVIINGSISGLAGIPKQAPYAPSKGAVVEMTRQLAVEYATRGVRVNCVCPGTVDTPVLRKGMAMSGDPEGFLAMLDCRPSDRPDRSRLRRSPRPSRSSPLTRPASSRAPFCRLTAATPPVEPSPPEQDPIMTIWVALILAADARGTFGASRGRKNRRSGSTPLGCIHRVSPLPLRGVHRGREPRDLRRPVQPDDLRRELPGAAQASSPLKRLHRLREAMDPPRSRPPRARDVAWLRPRRRGRCAGRS